MNKIYMFLKILFFLLLCIVIFVPFIIFIMYLKNNNKTVTIYPVFKVVDITNNTEYDEKLTDDSIRIGKEILEKIKNKS